MWVKFSFPLILVLFLFGETMCDIAFTLSARYTSRNLPPGKIPFPIVNYKQVHECEPSRVGGSQNPDWGGDCIAPNNTKLAVQIWHHRTLWPDDTIGYSQIYTEKLPEPGKSITEEIWRDGSYRGTLRITTKWKN